MENQFEVIKGRQNGVLQTSSDFLYYVTARQKKLFKTMPERPVYFREVRRGVFEPVFKQSSFEASHFATREEASERGISVFGDKPETFRVMPINKRYLEQED